MKTQAKKLYPFMIFFIFGWVIFTILYALLKQQASAIIYARFLEFIVLLAFHITVIIYAFNLWRKSGGKAKLVFGFLILATIFVMIDSAIYHIAYNILQIPHSQLSAFWVSADNIPYLLFLIFQLLMWITILSQPEIFKEKFGKLFISVPIGIVVIVIFALFVLGWRQAGSASFSGFYNVADKVFELAVFIGAAFCFAISRNRGLLYLSLGFLVDTAFSSIMDFGISAQAYGVGSILETVWVLTWFLRLYGLMHFNRAKTYKDSPRTWICDLSSIRAQITFWIFAACILVLCAFLVLVCILAPRIFF